MFPVPGDNIELTKPTIAAVNGVAFAGGWMIAQACDLCVASTSAKFAITEVKVGRSSPWAAPLIHMIPQRIMMEIILTGKPITAQRAYEIGLVNRLAEPEQLMDAALELAAEILDGAPLSVQAGRETVMLVDRDGPFRRVAGCAARVRIRLSKRGCAGRSRKRLPRNDARSGRAAEGRSARTSASRFQNEFREKE